MVDDSGGRRRRWEYLHEYIPASARPAGGWWRRFWRTSAPLLSLDTARLNELGRQGWELVYVEPNSRWRRWGSGVFPAGTLGYYCLFKRALPPDY